MNKGAHDIVVHATPAGRGAFVRPALSSLVLFLTAGFAIVPLSTVEALAKKLPAPSEETLEDTDTKDVSRPRSLLDEDMVAAKLNSCTILVGGAGTLVANASRDALSSDFPGGIPGTAMIITTNASFSFFYEAPDSFALQPSSFSGTAMFKGTVSGNGATDFMNVAAGQGIRLKRGTTNVAASLTASMQGSAFASGQYTTMAVLRCE